MTNSDKTTRVQQITQRIQNNRFLAALIVVALSITGVATFTHSFRELLSLLPWKHSAAASPTAVPVEWKIDSGWVLIGDYHQVEHIFVRKFFEVVHSNYTNVVDIPRQGDSLRLTAERSLIILDYANQGLAKMREPPWHGGVLKQADYTPWKLPKGAVVEVREVSMPNYPDAAAVVWVRVAKPSE